VSDALAALVEEFKADWRQDAACIDEGSRKFFPERGQTSVKAKVICMECPVQKQCLDYAMRTNQENGIWGMLSEPDRIKLRKSSDWSI